MTVGVVVLICVVITAHNCIYSIRSYGLIDLNVSMEFAALGCQNGFYISHCLSTSIEQTELIAEILFRNLPSYLAKKRPL